MKTNGNTATILITGAAVIAVALVALAFGGAFGTDTSVSSSNGAVPTERLAPPRDGSAGVVTGAFRSKVGLDLLGWQISPDRYAIHVAMVPPEGCEPMKDGEVREEGACGDAATHGPVIGGGDTGGYTFITVEVEVDRACAEAVQEGDTWPPEHDACTP